MGYTLLTALATPEADNAAVRGEIVIEPSQIEMVDWEQMLERGGGPCLALGAERRQSARPLLNHKPLKEKGLV